MSTIVLTTCTTSEAYKADSHLCDEGMRMISGCEGVLANYHGIAMEDNNLGYTVQVATSAEAFIKVVSNEELFQSILAKMEPGRIGGIQQYHANAISDPAKALVGPVTEICVLSLKNPTPENKAAFENTGKMFNELTEGKWTYGWCGGDENKAIVIAAWDSVEAHEARGKEPDVAETLRHFMEIVEIHGGPYHLKLTQV